MEQRHESELQKVKQQIASSSSNAAIAKDFVERTGSSTAGPSLRFDDHDFALCSRVLSQLTYSFFHKRVQQDVTDSWFPPRSGMAGSAEGETELGALFKVLQSCCWTSA